MGPAERKLGAGLATERQTVPPHFLPPAEKHVQTPSASGFLGKQLWSKPVETQPDQHLQHSSSSPRRYIHPPSLTAASANKATRSSPPSFGAKTASLRNHQLLFCSDTEEEQSRARSPHPPAEPAPRHRAAPVPGATCYRGIGHGQRFARGAPRAPEPSKAPLPRAVLVTFRRRANRSQHRTPSARSKAQLLATSAKD